MQFELVKTFRFEAAHSLAHAPDGHKCRRLHGHSYRLDVHVTGQPDPNTGWVIDFAAIKATVEPIVEQLDHRCLDDLPDLTNSTSEALCEYLWQRIAPKLPELSAITIWESETSKCIYRGS